MITFVVPGDPQQQGSKNQFGGEDNKKLKPWRALAIFAAQAEAGPDWQAIDGPVEVEVWFYFARPKSHYGTGKNAAMIKASAPHPCHAQKPDCDKLQRAVGDVLTQAGIVKDDSRISDWLPHKRWHTSSRTEVTVRPILD